MKWFKHFTDAHDSNDLTKLRMKYGANGYAIYWYCLELIAGDLGSDEKITFELKHDAEVIGFNLKIDSAIVQEIMRYMVSIGLFENANNVITCLKLAKYLDKKTTRNETIKLIVDSAKAIENLSPTNTDKYGQMPTSANERQPSGLDTDTDTDTEEKNKDNIAAYAARESKLPPAPQKIKIPFHEIVSLYHEILPELPAIAKLTDTRKAKIKSRFRDDFPELDDWREYFTHVRNSAFLMGRAPPSQGRKPFIADFDFLINEANAVKIYEGKYHG